MQGSPESHPHCPWPNWKRGALGNSCSAQDERKGGQGLGLPHSWLSCKWMVSIHRPQRFLLNAIRLPHLSQRHNSSSSKASLWPSPQLPALSLSAHLSASSFVMVSSVLCPICLFSHTPLCPVPPTQSPKGLPEVRCQLVTSL